MVTRTHELVSRHGCHRRHDALVKFAPVQVLGGVAHVALDLAQQRPPFGVERGLGVGRVRL